MIGSTDSGEGSLLKLMIDSREPSIIKEVGKTFFEENPDITVEVAELETGDFTYDKLIIERKEINDLISSIMDKRLKSQKRRMIELQNNGYHCYVIIMGQYKDIDEYHKLSKKHVAGTIASLNEYGIHTINTGRYDFEMLFEVISGLIRKFNQEKKVEEVFVEPPLMDWTTKALMCIPDVGTKTALEITENIKHLEELYKMTPESCVEYLQTIKGVGSKTAEKIKENIYED